MADEQKPRMLIEYRPYPNGLALIVTDQGFGQAVARNNAKKAEQTKKSRKRKGRSTPPEGGAMGRF